MQPGYRPGCIFARKKCFAPKLTEPQPAASFLSGKNFLPAAGKAAAAGILSGCRVVFRNASGTVPVQGSGDPILFPEPGLESAGCMCRCSCAVTGYGLHFVQCMLQYVEIFPALFFCLEKVLCRQRVKLPQPELCFRHCAGSGFR